MAVQQFPEELGNGKVPVSQVVQRLVAHVARPEDGFHREYQNGLSVGASAQEDEELSEPRRGDQYVAQQLIHKDPLCRLQNLAQELIECRAGGEGVVTMRDAYRVQMVGRMGL